MKPFKSYQQMIADKMVSGKALILRPRCNGKKMSDKYFLNEDHTYRPCSLMEWAEQLEELSQQGKKHVADDEINGCRISTVWLGLNHRWDNGPPLVFETMVFNPKGKDTYCVRYTTWEQAEVGHQEAIEWVKNGCKEDE